MRGSINRQEGEASVNRQSSLRFAVAFIFAAFVAAALAFADVGARTQNASNSNTGEDSAQNSNANTPRRGRGRRGRRGTNANANANANSNAGDANANTGDEMRPVADNANTGGAQDDDDMPRDLSGERADLSGNYSGHVVMSGGHDMEGEATLTITGNTFQLSGEGMNHGGRVYAVVTRGYIGAAFYFTDLPDATTNTPVVANVRARKSGERLTLTPVPSTRTRLTFAPAGGGRRRG